MSIFTKPVCAFVVAAAVMAAPVSAAVVSADFVAEFDLPDFSFGTGARVLENNGVLLGAGDELDLADEVSNPSGWLGGASVDLSADGLLTFTGQEGDFDYAVVMVSDIMTDNGSEIIGFSQLPGASIFTSAGIRPRPIIRFGPDFFMIFVDTTGSGGVSDFDFSDGGTVQYQLEFSPVPVPLPAGGLLLGTALVGFGLARRKRNLT